MSEIGTFETSGHVSHSFAIGGKADISSARRRRLIWQTALEFRAQSAEANLHEAKQALLQVEEAIRERLLSEKRSSIEAQHDLASPSENG
jgi:hypothetical protein